MVTLDQLMHEAHTLSIQANNLIARGNEVLQWIDYLIANQDLQSLSDEVLMNFIGAVTHDPGFEMVRTIDSSKLSPPPETIVDWSSAYPKQEKVAW